MIVTCHQPNFFPWMPYFDKIKSADKFIVLGNVQFTRHQFQNRFFYQNKWHTMSVNKGNLHDRIVDKLYIDADQDWNTIKNRLPNLELTEFDKYISRNLFKTNSDIILHIMEFLQINTKYEFEKEISYENPSSMLIEICRKNQADTYLSGPSGKKYLDLLQFKENNIKVEFFETTNHETFVDFWGRN
jgi:hypothetical protein